jgi:hypothetical protein
VWPSGQPQAAACLEYESFQEATRLTMKVTRKILRRKREDSSRTATEPKGLALADPLLA